MDGSGIRETFKNKLDVHPMAILSGQFTWRLDSPGINLGEVWGCSDRSV